MKIDELIFHHKKVRFDGLLIKFDPHLWFKAAFSNFLDYILLII